MPRAVVLIIDGLGAKHLGPYGNTWIETTAFNHLASESLLLENVFAPFADPWQSIEALWRGNSAIANEVPALKDTDLLTWLDGKGVKTKLLTDDADLTDQRLAADFADQFEIAQASGLKLANEWDETHAASFFAQSINAIEQLEDNHLLWLHTRGLGNPWDAPYEYRSQFADEEDPEPTGSAQVPSLRLDADYDPDTLHEIQCAFAGQVVLLDQCLGVMLSVIREMAASKNTLFVVTSPRGYPLGEHLHVGWKDSMLYHELLQVPAFVRFPDGRHALHRSAGLGEISDLTDVMTAWFEGSDLLGMAKKRDCSFSLGKGEVLLRSPVWQLRFPGSALSSVTETTAAELYLKPDDQNEVNDVADRCNHVVEASRQFIKQTRDGSQPTVPTVLLEPPE